MNKRNLIIAVLAALCLIFAGCAMESKTPETKGSLTVRAGYTAGSRGAAPDISMNTSYYVISGTGPNGETFEKGNIQVSNPTVTVDGLTAGLWTVKAIAYNSASTAIGEGSSSVTINPGTQATCSITVAEYPGSGTFTLMLTGLNDVKEAFTVEIYSASNEQTALYSQSTSAIDGACSFIFEKIPNGFYVLKVTPPAGSNMPAFRETFRIVSDKSTTVRYAVTVDGQIEIENVIVTTPEITISPKYTIFAANEDITASASVISMPAGASSAWYVDGEKIESATSNELSIPASSYEVGSRHIITYEIRDVASQLVWSKSAVINIGPEIVKPELNTVSLRTSMNYGTSNSMGFFSVSNISSLDYESWKLQWYIDDAPYEQPFNIDSSQYYSYYLYINDYNGNYALGSHSLKLVGTYNNERTYTFFEGSFRCTPSISITGNTYYASVINGQKLSFEARINPNADGYNVKWYFSPSNSTSERTEIGSGLKLEKFTITEAGSIEVALEDVGGNTVSSGSCTISSVVESPQLEINYSGSLNEDGALTIYLNNNSSPWFSVDSYPNATYTWYLNNEELYVGSAPYNIYPDFSAYSTGGSVILRAEMTVEEFDDVYHSNELTIVFKEGPYISIPETHLSSAVATEVIVTLVDNSGMLDGATSINLDFSNNGYSEWVSAEKIDDRSYKIKITPPEKPTSRSFSYSLYGSFTDSDGNWQSIPSSNGYVYLDYYNEPSNPSYDTYPSIIVDRRVVRDGDATVTASIINFDSYIGGEGYTTIINWYLDNKLIGTDTDVKTSTVKKEIDLSSVSVGTHFLRAEYKHSNGGSSSSGSFSTVLYKIDNQPLSADRVFYKQFFSSGSAAEAGYEVIVVDDSKNLYEKSVVNFVSTSYEDNAVTIESVIGEISTLNTDGYRQLSGEKGTSSYIGYWKMPNITADNAVVNLLLDRFVNNMEYFNPAINKLVELTDAQKNSVDAYFTIDPDFCTVLADVNLAATGVDGAVALPSVFNAQGEVTYNYLQINESTGDISLEDNSLGLSFTPSTDGSVLVLTAYIPMDDLIHKIVLPLERVSSSSVVKLPGEKAFASQKTIRLGDELSQIKTISDAVDKDEFFFDSILAYKYQEVSQEINLGGEWVLDEASLAKLPEGVPSSWFTYSDSSIISSNGTDSYSIYRDSEYNGDRYAPDYTTLGDGIYIRSSSDGSNNKGIQFRNVVISGDTITFDVRAAKEGTPYKEYKGITATKAAKSAGEIFQDMINSQISFINDFELIFNTDGTVAFSAAMGSNNININVGTYTVGSDRLTVVSDIFGMLADNGMSSGGGIPDAIRAAITLPYSSSTGKVTVLNLLKANEAVTLTLK